VQREAYKGGLAAVTQSYDWRWVLGRKVKGLPVERTFDEKYRTDVLVGPGRLEVGSWSHWFPTCTFCTWTPEDSITIGSYTSIAAGTTLLSGGEHLSEHISTFTFNLITGEDSAVESLPTGRIVIGSDVWLATQCMVLSPVTIGHGAIVAARSVVTHDVPPYAVVAGAPARVIRYRFPPETIERLMRLAWWDWPEEHVRACIPLLRDSAVDALELYAQEHIR